MSENNNAEPEVVELGHNRYQVLVNGKPATGPLTLNQAVREADKLTPKKKSDNLLSFFVGMAIFLGLLVWLITGEIVIGSSVAIFVFISEVGAALWYKLQ